MEVEMKIRGLMMDPATNMPIVILKDINSNTVLPIWVGIYEANAIALEIEKVSTPRPMTHDLMKSVLLGLRTGIRKVVVNELKEERGEREQVARAHRLRGSRHRPGHDLAQVGGARAQRQREHRHRDGGLGERGHRHLAARPHAPERRPRIEAGQGQEEGAEQEQVDHHQEVADRVERQRHRQDREQQHDAEGAGEHHVGREPEQPRGVGRDHRLLGQELAQLEVRLPDRRPTPVLHPRLQPPDQPDEAGGQGHAQQRLAQRERVAARRPHGAPMTISTPSRITSAPTT